MKIEITSYQHGLSDKIRLNLTKDIINNSTADLLLFSGHTIGYVNDIETLKTQIDNKQIEVVLELENINSDIRLSDNKSLTDRFNKLLKGAKIILNPIHTPMGNQGKLQKRREFLSNDKRYYFSASNTKEDSGNLEIKSLQYAFYNGKPLTEIDTQRTEYSISRIYEIK